MPSPITPIPIPVPTDGTDAPHSTISAVTALRCVAESFDAVMDSLQASIDAESGRLDQLSDRAGRCRDSLRRRRAAEASDEGEGPLLVRLPKDYKRAIVGADASSSAEDDEEAATTASRYTSAIAAARDASNESVRRVLRRDYELDDGGARMSDLWLDKPRAFDVGASCRSALRTHAVPSLAHQRPLSDGIDFYKEGGVGGSQSGVVGRSASSTAMGLTASGASSGSPSEWDGAASVRTGVSLSTRATNAAAGATASDRRRQRQLQSLARKRSAGTTGDGAAGTGGEDGAGVASTNRQQALSGSRPYLCEILHDAYGAGEFPPDGDAGTIFPAPRAIGELRVFHSSQPAYGSAARLVSPQAAKVEADVKASAAKVGDRKLSSGGSTPKTKGSLSAAVQK